ncbi:MAG TPA: sigma-70 family RNA polymerase sigma factor [Bryobacteraceae bacterium]|jgi:RNA polymerase sigma factor (sigma-70 family)|nr:sigma-70 family RNA polymerase sigma factor [Bryobacteraceae bacterium]
MIFSDEDIEKLRPKVSLKVSYEVGFYCPDIDDLVQETLTRFLSAAQKNKIRDAESFSAFLNGICRNVILEYWRRSTREAPMPEVVPESPAQGIPEADLLEMRQAIALGMEQMSSRDRQILTAFYLEDKTKDEILKLTGMSDENFRVALCRAKERFRNIYTQHAKHRGASAH